MCVTMCLTIVSIGELIVTDALGHGVSVASMVSKRQDTRSMDYLLDFVNSNCPEVCSFL
jgi:hypothetical protein